MAEIKTRILLRNDTLANWEAAGSVTLKKGEIGIAMLDGGTLAELRVGDNTSWTTSRKLRVEASQISGLIETINNQINGLAQEYQLIAGTDTDANKWFLQYRPLSGGEWSTKSTLDLTQLTGYALSTDVDALVNAVSVALSTDYSEKIESLSTATKTLVGAVSAETLVSANAYTNAAIDALSIDNYMLTATFNALSNTIGLSAATAENPVVTMDDIKDLAGAMHFRGAITPNEGETDLEALAREITDPASGDVAIITTTSKEYVYNGESWIELGDEVLYATKAEVSTISAKLTADIDYLSGQIDETNTTLGTVSSDLTALIGTTSAETLLSANAYTDNKFADLSDYYKKSETSSAEEISTAVDELDEKITKKIFVENKISGVSAYSDLSVIRLSAAEYANLLTSDSLLSNAVYIVEDDHEDAYGRQIKNVAPGTDLSDAVNLEQLAQTSATTLSDAKAYTDSKFADLSGYYTKDEINAISTALSTDYSEKIVAVDNKLPQLSADSISVANAYTDEKIAALSADEFIRHGEVVQSDLSGYFVFDCGGASYREGEQAATES